MPLPVRAVGNIEEGVRNSPRGNVTMLTPEELLATFNPSTGTIDGHPLTMRRLSDLRGLFVDSTAFEAALAKKDSVVYTVSTIDLAKGEGQLHCGLGVVYPGRVGGEYYFTKGHLHSWRKAAEFYIGLKGKGVMILEDETSGESLVLDLLPNSAVYVPGHTAHRTVNTGTTPLVYIGVYPSEAGHDYDSIGDRNFKKVVFAKGGVPTVIDRTDYILHSQEL